MIFTCYGFGCKQIEWRLMNYVMAENVTWATSLSVLQDVRSGNVNSETGGCKVE